jgi:peptidoglycan/xylan/chitin deacetylase (PgdA/CDA1 family)
MIVSIAKWVLYHLGVLAAYHHWQNRSTLTVLMFHRVLPEAVQDSSQSDPLWTISTRLFDDIVKFTKRHYHLVRLEDVVSATVRGTRLPPRALLLSFDDGWRDNLCYALPILNRHGVSAALFVSSDAIEGEQICWWQDVVLWSLRTGRIHAAELLREVSAMTGTETAAEGPENELGILVRLNALEPAIRDAVLEPLTKQLQALQEGRQMLDASSLRALAAAGVGIGSHGAAHLPLTELADPAGDLEKAQRRIGAVIDNSEILSLSFPHGRYDGHVLHCARTLGYVLQFTSEAVINDRLVGRSGAALIGRIPVFARQVSRPDGGLSEPRLAAFLFLRHRKRLAFHDDIAGCRTVVDASSQK